MKIIDKLTEDILSDEYFNILFDKVLFMSIDDIFKVNNSNKILTSKELNDSLRFSDILSNSTNIEAKKRSYQIITNLNKKYNDHKLYKTVSKSVYSKLGNFPAIKYLIESNSNYSELPIDYYLQFEAKKIIQKVPDSDNLVFTDSQYELFSKLNRTLEFSFSGPTSMGKSFIIKAFIKVIMKNNPPENLVILVPTRALINQFAIELKEETRDIIDKYKYRILTNSSINDLNNENQCNFILVLTPERFISYMTQESNPNIGFLFVDEAHKLANDKDSRSITTYTAIEKAQKRYGKMKLYFSSPNVSNPEIFLDLFNRNTKDSFYKTKDSPVSQNLFFIDIICNKAEYIREKEHIYLEYEDLLSNINSVNELIYFLGKGKNNLIYCNSKSKTISEAIAFSNHIVKKQNSEILKKAINQISRYIHPDYYLIDLLNNRVAFHYGRLPQLIRNLVEDLYKKEEIKNVFCTSTLLEGVNMPTQNIFIIDNKNGRKKLAPIDFWNLSGRAGRLSRELSGNIFCVQHSDCDWDNKSILDSSEILLHPTVVTKIDRNIKKIESIINDHDISGTEEEKFILKYLANIISIDTLDVDSNYISPVINKLISNNKEKIIELARKKVEDYSIPSSILNSNQSINLKVQENVYNILRKSHQEGKQIVLPNSSSINYEVCKTILTKMYNLYDWKNAEKRLRNEKSILYYAMLMNQWINGINLNHMIKQSIDYYERTNSKIEIDFNVYAPYQRGNKKHINIVIENIIENIEYILRFLFEKYFNHYYQILIKILGEENAGENWASLLEYGTQNRIIIALQNIGLSRHSAIKIHDKCKDALEIKDSKLININKKIALSHFSPSSLEYDEISRII